MDLPSTTLPHLCTDVEDTSSMTSEASEASAPTSSQKGRPGATYAQAIVPFPSAGHYGVTLVIPRSLKLRHINPAEALTLMSKEQLYVDHSSATTVDTIKSFRTAMNEGRITLVPGDFRRIDDSEFKRNVAFMKPTKKRALPSPTYPASSASRM